MEIPFQLLKLPIPSFKLVGIYRWRVGESWRNAFAKVGWQASKLIYHLWSLVVLVAVGGLAWMAVKFIPPEHFQSEYRRAGFIVGSTIQSLVILPPHLMRFEIHIPFWLIQFPQHVAGWLHGRLRFCPDSFLPGWLCHPLSNTLCAFAYTHQ